MIAIARIRTTLSTTWDHLPRGSVPLLAITASIWISKKITSDYRIRAALILGTVALSAIASLFRTKVQVQPQELTPPSPAPDPLPKDLKSYFSLLPEELLRKTGRYVDYATYRLWDPQRPVDTALHILRQSYQGNSDDERVARKLLATEGIPFCTHFKDALKIWKRYQAVIAPESKLFQGIPHRVSVKKLPINSKSLFVKGPSLIIKDERGYVAYHWPTATIQWIQEDRTLPLEKLDLKTGELLARNTPFIFDDLSQLEIVEERRLICHTHNQEIHLTQTCNKVLTYHHPILLFENEQGIWVKNGDQPEILMGKTNGYRFIHYPLVQFPYCVGVFFSIAERKLKAEVYNLNDGKLVTRFPHGPTYSIEQRIEITPEGPKSKDTLYYVGIEDNSWCEVRVSLQDPEQREVTPIQNFPFHSTSWDVRPVHINYFLQKKGALEIYRHGRPFTYFLPETEKEGSVESVYNSFVLISAKNSTDLFVIDLAEQSLTAQPLPL